MHYTPPALAKTAIESLTAVKSRKVYTGAP